MRLSRLSLVAAAALILGIAVQGPVEAHNSLCSHTHVYLTRVECTNEGDRCNTGSEKGFCIERVKYSGVIAYRDCFCVTATGDYIEAVDADALSSKIAEAGQIQCGLEGAPGPGAVVRCSFDSAAPGVIGFWRAAEREAFAGFDTSAASGYFELLFGDFSNPSKVPVALIDASFNLPSIRIDGRATGRNRYSADLRAASTAFYNAETRQLHTPLGRPLGLVLTNQLGEVAVDYVLGGELDLERGIFTFNYTAQYPEPAGLGRPAGERPAAARDE